MYDVEANTWTAENDFPIAVAGAAVVAHDNTAWY